jgi:hypothetical protein
MERESYMAKRIKVPMCFYQDHRDRALPTPTDHGNAKRYALIELDDPATADLLSDAEFYCHPNGPDAYYLGGLKASAKATVKAIKGAA